MEDKENNEELLKWLQNGKEQIHYTFQDWIEGKPEVDFWEIDKEKSIKLGYETLSKAVNEINDAQNWAWDYALEIETEVRKESLEWTISLIEHIADKKTYLIEEKKKLIKEIELSEISEQDLILKKKPPEFFNLISGEIYQKIKNFSDENKPKFVLGIIENIYFESLINHSMLKFTDHKINELSNPESIKKNEKGKSLAVRYTLLKMLGLERTTEFLALSETQKVAFIRFVLACDESTAKGLKNGYGKYIEPRHEKEAKELFDKIKKGEIL